MSSFLYSQDINKDKLNCTPKNKKVLELFNFGIKALNFGKIDYAKKAFQKAINLDTTFCDAYDNLAYIYRKEGDLKTALYLLHMSIESYPNNPQTLQNFAYYWLLLGKPVKAKKNYIKLIELDPQNPEGYYGLGLVLMELHNYQESLLKILKAIQLYKYNSQKIDKDVYYLLGLNYFHLGDYKNAVVNFEEAYQKYKNEQEMNYNLGICYLDLI